MVLKTLYDIAVVLKRHLGKSSYALLYTLELAVIKKYIPEIIEELEKNIKDKGKLAAILNRAYYRLSLSHKITEIDDNFPIQLIAKYLIEADIDFYSISKFLQKFTIDKSSNDLYRFSTPIELKELMVGLLDIKERDSIYNPCFGIGGFFIDIAKTNKNVNIYAEDSEGINRVIAGLTAQLSGIKRCSLKVSNVIANPAWCNKKNCGQFNKVICNPPFDASFYPDNLKDDFRFKRFGIPPLNASEFLFLEHLLAAMKEKGVFLIRESLLQRSSKEAKIRTKIAYDGYIESIISLPKGIIPNWKENMALMVLSKDNKEIFFVDANRPYFIKRKGRRNTIFRTNELIDTVLNKKEKDFSLKVPIKDISAISLAPSYYLKNSKNSNEKTLKDIAVDIFRAQRISIYKKDYVKYHEIGLKDIVTNGYTLKSKNIKKGDREKVEKFKLKENDILLPLRGSANIIGIIGKVQDFLIPNSGIMVIRLKNTDDAYGLYIYLKSAKGGQELQKLYNEAPNKTLNKDILGTLKIPENLSKNSKDRFEKICKYQEEINFLKSKVDNIINGIANP